MKKWLMVLLMVLVWNEVTAQTVIFSESKQVAAVIEKKIRLAKRSVWVAMYAFTNPKLAVALTNTAARGVEVVVIADKGQAAGSSSCVPMLTEVLGTNRVFCMFGRAGKYSVMHHKFALIDGKTVLTGSYNWTKRADDANWENFLVIGGRRIAGVYSNQFQVLREAAIRLRRDGPGPDLVGPDE